jgi:hypothetical protein
MVTNTTHAKGLLLDGNSDSALRPEWRPSVGSEQTNGAELLRDDDAATQ